MGMHDNESIGFKATVIILLLLIFGLLAYVGFKVENIQRPQYSILHQINQLNNTLQTIRISMKDTLASNNNTPYENHTAYIKEIVLKSHKKSSRAIKKLNKIRKMFKQTINQLNSDFSELKKGLNQKEELSEQLYKKMQVFQDYLRQVQEYLTGLLEPLMKIKGWF